jgi:hypothetical protein
LLDVLVGAVADDKGDALIGLGRIGGEEHPKHGKKDDDVAHVRSPIFKVAITCAGGNPAQVFELCLKGLARSVTRVTARFADRRAALNPHRA